MANDKKLTHADFTPREHAMKDHLAKHDGARDKFGAWFGEANKEILACKSLDEVHALVARATEMKEPITLMVFGEA